MIILVIMLLLRLIRGCEMFNGDEKEEYRVIRFFGLDLA